MLQRFSGRPGVLCLAFLPVLLSAADSKPTLLVDADHRPSISLDGDWHAIVDPYDNGYLDFRMQPRPDGYFSTRSPGRATILVEYDFAKSATLMCLRWSGKSVNVTPLIQDVPRECNPIESTYTLSRAWSYLRLTSVR